MYYKYFYQFQYIRPVLESQDFFYFLNNIYFGVIWIEKLNALGIGSAIYGNVNYAICNGFLDGVINIKGHLKNTKIVKCIFEMA